MPSIHIKFKLQRRRDRKRFENARRLADMLDNKCYDCSIIIANSFSYAHLVGFGTETEYEHICEECEEKRRRFSDLYNH